MYIDRFINSKYTALLSYRFNLNNKNSVIVDFKYGIRNKTLLLHQIGKKFNFNVVYLRKFLSKLRRRNKIILGINIYTYLYKKKLRRKRISFFNYVNKARISLLDKERVKIKFIKNLKQKSRKFKKQLKQKTAPRIRLLFSSYNFIDSNTHLHKYFKKNKMLRFLIQKLLHNQVLGNVALLGGFLDLNLHPLFLKRFKFHFLVDLGNIRKKHFNYNNFNKIFASKVFPRLIKFSSYISSLSGIIVKNSFYYSLYLRALRKLKNLLSFNFNVKYWNRYKFYMSNSTNINYVRVSFKLNVVHTAHLDVEEK